MKRFFWSWFIWLNSLFVLVIANTESFLVKVPKDFPVGTSNHIDDQFPVRISLNNSNHAKETIETHIGEVNPTYIQLQHLQIDEVYQVKICWTALDPVSIDEMGWFIVPHSTSLQGTTSEEARIFIKFTITNDSYPTLKPGTMVPINVSVINCKLGVPVDLYKTIVYIIAVAVSAVLLNRKYSLYDLLRH